MDKIPVTAEVAAFVVNILKASRAGALNWESTSAKTFTATLDGNYRVQIQEVPDFEDERQEPDHAITLFAGVERLFTVDRRDVTAEELEASLGESVDYSYAIFSELWRRAQMKATGLGEHLALVNQILEKQIDKRRN